MLSVALPAFRYGIDSIDISKAALGIRGSGLVLMGLLVSALGWAGVALAMVARGVGFLVARAGHPGGVINEQLVVVVGLVLIGLLFLLVQHGLDVIRRLNEFAGPGFVILAIVSLLLLLWKYGPRELLLANVPAEQALTTDRLKSFTYALEFGVTLAMAWWPYMGGLYRFLKFRRHAVGPIMFGGSLIGNAFSASVAALAAVHLGSPDPAVWLIELAGPVAGTVMVGLVLLLSVPAICLLVFFVASAAQQIRPLARTSWNWLVALALVPLLLVALNTSWTLSHVVTVATAGSLIFFSVCGIVMVDYWILRGGSIELHQLFVAGPRGHYWYWGGVNWVAAVVIATGVMSYLLLYNPITLEARTAFRYVGAALPVIAGSGLMYYMLMRLIAVPLRRGGFGARGPTESEATTAEVTL